jgi:hypothetical protein
MRRAKMARKRLVYGVVLALTAALFWQESRFQEYRRRARKDHRNAHTIIRALRDELKEALHDLKALAGRQ